MKANTTYSKIRGLALAISVFIFLQTGFGQTWNWVVTGAGSANDNGGATCTDATGNIIVGGDFNSNPLQMGTVTLNNSGGSDGFVAKYNANGVLQWAQRIGSTNNESVSDVACDASGNIYVLGYFNSPFLTVAPLTGISNYTNTFTYDMFVVCYNPSGVGFVDQRIWRRW
jgi:hypothetical protein